ncbi:TPM domain-containing protein [Methylocapsa aurea]|uniref:TPM domain-containing protein n=1 Tax=Methylocapsa aurea TaxID=663610 RepID=UPI001FD962A9|nr:TPM domain-containing protein [Methylocapsa aurea]
MRSLAAGLFAAIAFAAALALSFPPLSGRVVDQAGIIPEAVRASLTDKLEALEAKSGIQFVVATVNSLEDEEIEPYANALFRNWKLGEKQKNNGLLLLIAPKQRKVRFEVGYGLEGTMTDALSKIIITNAMTPRFKTGDFGGGIERGVDDAITVLTTDASEWQKRPELRLDRHGSTLDNWTPWIVFALFLLIVFMLMSAPRIGAPPRAASRWGAPASSGSRWGQQASSSRWGDPRTAPPQSDSLFWSNLLSFLLGMLMNSGRGGGRGGWGDDGGWGGGSGGGFSGGGGSSGGGGASGGW